MSLIPNDALIKKVKVWDEVKGKKLDTTPRRLLDQFQEKSRQRSTWHLGELAPLSVEIVAQASWLSNFSFMRDQQVVAAAFLEARFNQHKEKKMKQRLAMMTQEFLLLSHWGGLNRKFSGQLDGHKDFARILHHSRTEIEIQWHVGSYLDTVDKQLAYVPLTSNSLWIKLPFEARHYWHNRNSWNFLFLLDEMLPRRH